MDLSKLQSKTPRKRARRVGRGGKRGFSSGGGTKGQKSRAGAYVRPGFRGGDNRIWQLFPKQKGASKKPGGKGPHRKHRFFRLDQEKPVVFNLGFFNQFSEKELINPEFLKKGGFVPKSTGRVKVLGGGAIKTKLSFEGLMFSKSARDKVAKIGGSVK